MGGNAQELDFYHIFMLGIKIFVVAVLYIRTFYLGFGYGS